MAATQTLIQLRVAAGSKKKAEAVYKRIGISVNDAIKMFLAKTAAIGDFPFDVRFCSDPEAHARGYSAETLAAIKEADEMVRTGNYGKTYSSAKEFAAEIEAEIKAERAGRPKKAVNQ
jgi:DNA-damage-inducible protein J